MSQKCVRWVHKVSETAPVSCCLQPASVWEAEIALRSLLLDSEMTPQQQYWHMMEDKHSTDVHLRNSRMVTWIRKYPRSFLLSWQQGKKYRKWVKFQFWGVTFSSLVHREEPEGPLHASWPPADLWLNGDGWPENLSGLRPRSQSGRSAWLTRVMRHSKGFSAGFQQLRKPRRQAWYRPASLTDTRSDVSQTLNAAFPPTGAAQGKAADMSLGNKKSDLSQLNVALSGASLPAKERMPPVINWNWVWKPSRMRLCCCQKDLWLHLLLEPPSWNNTDHQAADPAPPPTACPLNKFHFHHSQTS